MWKLLIADDEPKIRRGLSAQIERMGLNIALVAEAENGETALALAEKTRPDLLLVDINMPFLNGLDFIERLRAQRDDARIIVITGYEEFDYARRALELSVHAYLLKPVNLAELKTALESAIAQLDRDKYREERFRWATAQLRRNLSVHREAFLRDLVTGALSEPEMTEQLHYFGIKPMANPQLIAVMFRADAAMQPWRYRMYPYAYADALKEPLSQCDAAYVFPDDNERVLILSDAAPEMQRQLADAARGAGVQLGLSTIVGETHAPSLAALSEAYEELVEQMRGSIGCSPAVMAARDYVLRHYANPSLSLTDAAEAAKVNPSYLSRLMKLELGTSFSKFLTTTRIQAALELMRGGEIKIREIAERTGYSTPHYFSTAFKKVLGSSPQEYRSEGMNK